MKKCQFCGKELTEENTVELNFVTEKDEPIVTVSLCSDCYEPLKELKEEDFSKIISNYVKDLDKNWEKGTRENSKPGKIIRILSLKGEEDHVYFGKTGVIDYIDDVGQLHGSWGGLAVIPEEDSYLVLKNLEGEVTDGKKD